MMIHWNPACHSWPKYFFFHNHGWKRLCNDPSLEMFSHGSYGRIRVILDDFSIFLLFSVKLEGWSQIATVEVIFGRFWAPQFFEDFSFPKSPLAISPTGGTSSINLSLLGPEVPYRQRHPLNLKLKWSRASSICHVNVPWWRGGDST